MELLKVFWTNQLMIRFYKLKDFLYSDQDSSVFERYDAVTGTVDGHHSADAEGKLILYIRRVFCASFNRKKGPKAISR